MATGWIKSLQCKSRASDDVVFNNHRRRRHPDRKTHHCDHPLSQSSSCKNSVQNLKDVVETAKHANKPKKLKPPKPSQTPLFKRPILRKPESAPDLVRTRSVISESVSPALTELPEGHPSRNVVEIIFHTSWGEKNFSGLVKMVFKVQNLTRTVSRFEEYRETVKSRASCVAVIDGSEDHSRCVADGNEVMRFYCLGATTTGGAYDKVGSAWDFHGGKGAVVSMFSDSCVAHEKAGGGRGPRAMLVCRVIAGRVYKKLKLGSLGDGRVGYDSVGGDNGELIVLDPRALLPCFLIIYEL